MESKKKIDVEAPATPTYEKAATAKNPSAIPPLVLDKKIETKRGNVVLRMNLEDGLGYRHPRQCCCACCCGYQGCALAIGIYYLVLTCLGLITSSYILGLMAFSSVPDEVQRILDWKLLRASIVAVTLFGLLIDIFNIIINVLLIVGVKTKNKKFVLVWVYVYILQSCVNLAILIWLLFAGMKPNAATTAGLITGFGIHFYFVRVVWKFQKLECNNRST